MRSFTVEDIIKTMDKLNYTVFKKGNYNINLVGIRSIENDESGEKVNNIFNDKIVVFYKVDKKWVMYEYIATTIPGLYYFKAPMMPEFGTAIMVPGQYLSAYSLGYHFSSPALVQVGNVSLYRDKNRDSIIDIDEALIQSGSWMGINIHYSWDRTTVDNFSAGCQVLGYNPNNTKYIEFLSHFRTAVSLGYNNSFSYTLIKESDID